MNYMFYNFGQMATNRTDINISGWNVNSVTDHRDYKYGATWITPPTWVS